ncbi:hypothetical protein [Dysgonomonas sp. 511]|uniref:hypothetical protein n=1 Tax=Dysgonomonas sp. 511 TaxID=2302930 RepID=UPI0013D278B1|nr:hypothetical protein [Dysgonomonas sp. 511]NDV77724.1 hypothetical protein [Dysgonomonas sp. 511]
MQESFKSRVAKFWKSFSEEEYQIREMMDNKAEGETLLNFVDSILQIAFHKVYFEMGINHEGKYELILTPEGDRAQLMLLHYWLQHAPEHLWEKWNFYSSKPAHGKPGSAIEMFGVRISDDDVTIYPETDGDRPKVNIEVCSPKLMALEENKRYSMFFIYMDQFIGELYSMEYIGYIDFVENKLDKPSTNMVGLKGVIDKAIEDNKWTKYENPTEIYSTYRLEPSEEEDWTLREDIFSGYTSCIPLINDFYNGENRRVDEAKENGVHFGFLFFENINIPREDVVNFRGDIEDKIIDQAATYGIAESLGGATGFHFSYIDFIIYDFEAFVKVAKEVLASYNFEETGYSDFTRDAEPQIFN